jgi:hypothetical protein
MSLHFFICVVGFYLCEIYYHKHFFSRVNREGYDFYKKLITDENISSKLIMHKQSMFTTILDHSVLFISTVFLLLCVLHAVVFGLSFFDQIRVLAATTYVSLICIGLYLESLSWHDFSAEFTKLANAAETEEEKTMLAYVLSGSLVIFSRRRFLYTATYATIIIVDIVTRYYIF